MIKPFISFLRDDINSFISNKIGVNGSFVFSINFNNITDNTQGVDDKIIISIVNMEEEKMLKNPANYTSINQEINFRKPPVWLNITCLFIHYTKSSENYEGIDMLANVVQYFQSRPRIDSTTAFVPANFPPIYEDIRAEFVTLNFEQSNNLWGLFGGRYYPSVVYKFKTIPIDNLDITPGGPPIINTRVDGKHKKIK